MEFLKLLKRVVKLHSETRMYNVNFTSFSYALYVEKDKLCLVISFPTHRDRVAVTYNSDMTEINSKLEEIESYMQTKREKITLSL